MKLLKFGLELPFLMAAEPYQQDSWGWQLRQLQQRLGEWWEKLTTRTAENLDIPAPTWLDHPLWAAIAKAIFWIVTIGLVVWLGWVLWKLCNPYIYRWRQGRDRFSHPPQQSSPAEMAAAQWLAKSRQFQRQGDYRQACLCLYRAMLQQLHDRGIAPHNPSRTDGEYLQIIQQLPQPQPYQALLVAHQQLCFSDRPASESLWKNCQQAYRALRP